MYLSFRLVCLSGCLPVCQKLIPSLLSDQMCDMGMQGSLSAVMPIAADVVTRNWMRSGIVVQLLRARSPLSAPTQIAAQPAEMTDSAKLCQQQCVARGVLHLSDLLDGCTAECSVHLKLTEVLPLFDDKGIRLGLNSTSEKTTEVRSSAHNTGMQFCHGHCT